MKNRLLMCNRKLNLISKLKMFTNSVFFLSYLNLKLFFDAFYLSSEAVFLN